VENTPTPATPGPTPETTFGEGLEAALAATCGDRLSPVNWFRTSWQRGGALTGRARWRGDDGAENDVVVKLPIPPQELRWLERLQADRVAHGPVVPRLYAGGRELGGYDLVWAVMQRMAYGPLDEQWAGREVELLVDAAARFHAACAAYEIDAAPRAEDWPDVLKRARAALRERGLPETQRWNAAVKALQKKLKKMLAVWDERERQWCHGDLHLANAMTADAPPQGPAVLFDLAMVHVGHWVEDAVYFEHLYWHAPKRLGGDIVKQLAQQRKAYGLKGDAHWPRLAAIRRALIAAAAPAMNPAQTSPAYLHAALGVLESALATA